MMAEIASLRNVEYETILLNISTTLLQNVLMHHKHKFVCENMRAEFRGSLFENP